MLQNTKTNWGQVAYEAYCAYTGNKSLATGQDLSTWANLAPIIQQAWIASSTVLLNKAYEIILKRPD